MITIAGVSKKYFSGRGELTALRDISFSIRAQEFTALVGKSGSGKSTVLNCIGGLEKPDAGLIQCGDINVGALGSRALSKFQRYQLGFIFQRGNLLSYLTVAENIGFPLFLNGYAGRRRQKRIDWLLERIDLGSAARALPHELSGGEVQRVAVARAIAHFPKVLLADEPTASLDTSTGKMIVDLMHSLAIETDCTILMATHDPEVTDRVDSFICLRDGRVTGEYNE
mgnify:CR=1 FL=1